MKIYVASKTHHVHMWRELRDEWAKIGLHINSRWLDEPSLVASDFRDESVTPEFLADAWMRNMHDLETASALVTYAEESDVLRGALIEIGAMLSYECPVIIVGFCSGVHGTHGSWQYHPKVVRVETMTDARDVLLAYAKGA